VAEDNESGGDLVEEVPSDVVLEQNDTVVVDEAEVTIWAPEPKGTDEVLQTSIEEWIDGVDFNSTDEVPIPKRLVDQVIGQEAGSIVIKKAAEQRRHMLMIGDPGTGNVSKIND